MANVFYSIPVPTSNGPGAPVSLAGTNFIKRFSLAGVFQATVNVEVSNDGVTWAPITSFTAVSDIKRSFAALFVRANVLGYVAGAPLLSVGADDGISTAVALTVPAGNGVGAPTDVSALGEQKTLIYDGGVDASITVEVSQDGVNFTAAANFTGRTPANINLFGATKSMRVRVGGFVIGTGVVTVAAIQSTTTVPGATVSPGTGIRQVIFVRPTGNDTTGDGTLLNPYLTPNRGLLDIPNIILDPDRYVIEMTGYGTYGNDIALPPTIGGRVLVSSSPSAQPSYPFPAPDFAGFLGELPITFQALPTTTVLADVVSSTLIGPAAIGGAVDNAMTNIRVPGTLIGQFLIGTAGSGPVGAIYDNLPQDIFYGGFAEPTPTLCNPSATITGTITIEGVQCAVQFNGVNIAALEATACAAPSFCMCDLTSLRLYNTSGITYGLMVFIGDSANTSGILRVAGLNTLAYFICSASASDSEIVTEAGSEGSLLLLDSAINGRIGQEENGTGETFTGHASLQLQNLAFFIGVAGFGGVTLLSDDNLLDNVYIAGGVAGEAAVAVYGGRQKLKNVNGGALIFGVLSTDYGVLVPNTGASAIITAIGCSLLTGTVADLQIGSLGPRTWADFLANPPVKIQADIGTAFGNTQSVVRDPT